MHARHPCVQQFEKPWEGVYILIAMCIRAAFKHSKLCFINICVMHVRVPVREFRGTLAGGRCINFGDRIQVSFDRRP